MNVLFSMKMSKKFCSYHPLYIVLCPQYAESIRSINYKCFSLAMSGDTCCFWICCLVWCSAQIVSCRFQRVRLDVEVQPLSTCTVWVCKWDYVRPSVIGANTHSHQGWLLTVIAFQYASFTNLEPCQDASPRSGAWVSVFQHSSKLRKKCPWCNYLAHLGLT